MKLLYLFPAVLACLCSLVSADERSAQALKVELNSAEGVGDGCRLSFLVENSLSEDIEALVFETALFSGEGKLVLLTFLDYEDVPSDRLRVRQFDVPEVDCNELGRVLLNDVHRCTMSGADSPQCAAALVVGSRLEIELLG